MDALLILSGIVLLVIGWLWLVVGSIHLSTGRVVFAALLPLVTLLRRDQGYPRAPRIVLAFACLAMAAGLALLFHMHPHRFERLMTGQWQTQPSPAQNMTGEVMGQRFQPDRIFWRGEDLVLEEGQPERVRRSLTIRFGEAPQLLDRVSIALLPTDAGRWPELLLQWHTGALESPGLRRVAGQYSLNLDVLPAEQGGARMRLHLALPSQHQTWLSGEATFDEAPVWLARIRQRQTRSPQAVNRPASEEMRQATPMEPRWQTHSVLAVVDEPRIIADAVIRVTTVSGRSHEGRFKGVTDEGRIVLARDHGPNQVDFQFHPVDIHLLEAQHRPR